MDYLFFLCLGLVAGWGSGASSCCISVATCLMVRPLRMGASTLMPSCTPISSLMRPSFSSLIAMGDVWGVQIFMCIYRNVHIVGCSSVI